MKKSEEHLEGTLKELWGILNGYELKVQLLTLISSAVSLCLLQGMTSKTSLIYIHELMESLSPEEWEKIEKEFHQSYE